MKKFGVFFFVVLASAVLVLSGCGKGASSSDSDKDVLSVWAMGDEATQFKTIADDFKKETGITLKVQAIPWGNAHDKLLTAVASKSGPDVIQMGSSWMSEFSKAKALLPIDEYIDKYPNLDPKRFYKGAVESTQFDGKTYGVPWYSETRVLYYRTDTLKKAGFNEPPKTWDELAKVSKKLGARGDDLYGLNLDPKEPTMPFMLARQNGSELVKDDKLLFNQAPFVEAVEYMDSFYKNGSSPTSNLGLNLVQSFGGDEPIIPMFVSGPWMIDTINTTIPDVKGKWNVAVLPKKENNISILGGANWSVFNYTDKKENAVKFLDYMSDTKHQLEWMKQTKSLPAVTEAADDKSLKDDKIYQVFNEQLKTAQPAMLTPSFDQFSQNFINTFEEIYKSDTDIQKAMDKFNEQSQAIYDSKK
ncbi:sugar ABC transporter substrate-binding protein [Brochothrix thermosphacta]|uniref:sugar ABC transporter substrate-binding protein n=1 Tax=Brochothrix thermosphacta TaxID=2756 RepID=UPI00265D1447|nr:sugar ABC transporter substrate-binding protein [Brochothrix thermosphacta]WKK68392.1 sugar ABC transporter substrate-binding protein [Brochothrix thermosphacta]